MVIELSGVQFWSEIILVISNRTRAARSFDFEITRMISDLIKTITKFSNVIGYQQPDLSINWTVAHVMLVIGQYASFCARCCGALCSAGFFSIHNDVLKSLSAQSMLCSFLEFFHSFD